MKKTLPIWLNTRILLCQPSSWIYPGQCFLNMDQCLSMGLLRSLDIFLDEGTIVFITTQSDWLDEDDHSLWQVINSLISFFHHFDKYWPEVHTHTIKIYIQLHRYMQLYKVLHLHTYALNMCTHITQISERIYPLSKQAPIILNLLGKIALRNSISSWKFRCGYPWWEGFMKFFRE